MKTFSKYKIYFFSIISIFLLPILSFAETVNNRATNLLPLPELSSCKTTAHPILPPKWKATAVLQSFTKASLTFAKFIYDESASAFRFTLSNIKGDSVDFLVTKDRKLYRLKGGDIPRSCILETTRSPFSVPKRDWLSDRAVCAGEAPVLEKNQTWWKTPRGIGADWIWYNTNNSLPFRTMYYQDAKKGVAVPIYERFSFNYFPSFNQVPSTNLSEITDFCERFSGKSMRSPSWNKINVNKLIDLFQSPSRANEIALNRQTLVEGVSQCSSVDDLPPPWPEQLQATVMMTSVSFAPNPFPSRVFYDWTKQAQVTSLHYNSTKGKDYSLIALLTGSTGYMRAEDNKGRTLMCQQSLPGPQVPNWQVVDNCECRAEIKPNTPLNPKNETTKIIWCPTDRSANEFFWTWYSEMGVPVVFMQTNASPTDGTGLDLADYYKWLPGSVAPAGTFTIPQSCLNKPKQTLPLLSIPSL